MAISRPARGASVYSYRRHEASKPHVPAHNLVSQTNKLTASTVGLNAPISSEGVHQELIEIDIPEAVAGTAVST